uniref:Putative secreted protein n=1 Tax=Ixodes ricinus TaxID=34613 RepID=A0A6B0U8V5_IXORI
MLRTRTQLQRLIYLLLLHWCRQVEGSVGCVSIQITEVHCPTLFCTGAGGASKSNEAIPIFTSRTIVKKVRLLAVHYWFPLYVEN